MNIAIFYKSYKKYGGQEKVIYSLSHFLADKGHKVTVYTSKIKDKAENQNITLKKIFIPPLPRGLRTLLFALISYRQAKRIKRLHPDACILGFGKTFYQDIYRSGGGVHKYYFQRAMLKYSNPMQRKLYKIKKYLSLSHWINILIEKLTFENKNLKVIIAPSEFVKKQILSSFNTDESKIKIIRNGVDLKRFYPNVELRKNTRNNLNIRDKKPVFSFVSTNHRLKGLEYLLQAARILKDKKYEFELIIAGGGDDKYFQRMINRLELSDIILNLGKVKEIEKVYNASDIFIYPTLFDTSAMVILEAMACSNVPVVSVYAGSSEIINENNGLLITDPANPEEIASKMEILLKSQPLVQKLQKKALETITSYPSSDLFSKIEDAIANRC